MMGNHLLKNRETMIDAIDDTDHIETSDDTADRTGNACGNGNAG
ncbi:hypothetical protein [Bifidobacterium sp. UTCIF-39]|nr:hypothetical protein [Bifidobacterium sp. UTCIF-39]